MDIDAIILQNRFEGYALSSCSFTMQDGILVFEDGAGDVRKVEVSFEKRD